jgi:hypothetical protein
MTKLEELREAYHLSSKEYERVKYVEPDVRAFLAFADYNRARAAYRLAFKEYDKVKDDGLVAYLAFAACNKARAAYHKELERLDD